MILTTKQDEGLKIAVQRYIDGAPYTVISGYAGTGKSTLVQYIIKKLNIPEHLIAYVAYTGKAAKVLQQKGCANAKTAHKLLYKAVPLPNGKYIFKNMRKAFRIIDKEDRIYQRELKKKLKAKSIGKVSEKQIADSNNS